MSLIAKCLVTPQPCLFPLPHLSILSPLSILPLRKHVGVHRRLDALQKSFSRVFRPCRLLRLSPVEKLKVCRQRCSVIGKILTMWWLMSEAAASLQGNAPDDEDAALSVVTSSSSVELPVARAVDRRDVSALVCWHLSP